MSKPNELQNNIKQLILPWIIWGIASVFYAHQYFLRISVSGLEPELVKYFHINAVAIGYIAAAFFVGYLVV